MIHSKRQSTLRGFYKVLDEIRERTGGPFLLSECSGHLFWPQRGVYFFYEPGEVRSDTGNGPRVVRVGTHALTTKSGTRLWNRLSQHAGSRRTGRGNHRGSIFRLLIGEALMRKDKAEEPRSWGMGGDAGAAAARFGQQAAQVTEAELALEQAVSRHICSMPFLFVAVDDEPSPESHRSVIERGAIRLLSNYKRVALDPPSKSWLGIWSGRERVRESGLWNNKHVDEDPDEAFLTQLQLAGQRTLNPRK